MSVTTRPVGTVSHPESASGARTLSPLGAKLLAVLRIAFGLVFLWAFIDKVFGLGFSTKPESAWINGGNPTYGYLSKGASGPFANFYHALAPQTWVTWLFMIALLAIGIALLLGIGLRITAVAGGLLYLMMWTVALPPTTNPIIDDHILGLISLAVLAATSAGLTWGLSKQWRAIPFVAKRHWLW
jgi:thiosulfate dehydrogenase (quinone) large subunit